jgi:hypothetical protein
VEDENILRIVHNTMPRLQKAADDVDVRFFRDRRVEPVLAEVNCLGILGAVTLDTKDLLRCLAAFVIDIHVLGYAGDEIPLYGSRFWAARLLRSGLALILALGARRLTIYIPERRRRQTTLGQAMQSCRMY